MPLAKINLYYGGISDDIRDESNGIFSLTSHYDIFSNPKRLTPYRSMIDDNAIASTSTTVLSYVPKKFGLANGLIFAFGRQISLDKLLILKKTSPVDSGSTWTIAASSTQTTNGVPSRESITPYKNYFFGVKVAGSGTSNKADVFRYGPVNTGTISMTDPFGGADSLTLDDSSLSRVAPGIIGKDDNLYLFYENKVAKIDSSFVLTAGRLTLPSNMTITSADIWGNFLAIGCKPVNTSETTSKIFLWNYIDDDVAEVVDCGGGDLKVVANLENRLVAISDSGNSAYSANTKTTIRQWSGAVADIVKELPYSGLQTSKFVKDGKVYFILSDGTTKSVWVYGRKTSSYPFAVTSDRQINGSTAVSAVSDFTFLGDYPFVIHGSGSIRRMDNQNNYVHTSSWTSQKYTFGDPKAIKILEAIGQACVLLPSSATLTLKYAVNGSTTFKTILTITAANTSFKEAVNEEGNSNHLFDDYNEIQFKLEGTGFAEPLETILRWNRQSQQTDD